MYYIIYKITNLINEKYYIGRHATKNINDDYMGSGIGIKNAINKYGKQNFVKEIIAMAKSRSDLWELEKIIVNEDVVKDPQSYNNSYGGKSYLDGLKQYDFSAYITHQKNAGKKGGVSAAENCSRDWHVKGAKASAKKRSDQYLYRLTTPDGQCFLLNSIELKNMCLKKEWNYDTLIWTRHMDRAIKRGPLRGFRLDQLSSPKHVKENKK